MKKKRYMIWLLTADCWRREIYTREASGLWPRRKIP